MRKTKVAGVYCVVHGKTPGCLTVTNDGDTVALCSHCHKRGQIEYVSIHHPLIASLNILLRCFLHGEFQPEYEAITIMTPRGGVKVVLRESDNKFEVLQWSMNGYKSAGHDFPLEHPRALLGVVRCMARLLRQDMPSADAIDFILENGPPDWVDQEWRLATDEDAIPISR